MKSFLLDKHGLKIKEDGALFSTTFQDIYQSDAGALEQAEHVFIKGNNLEEKFLKGPIHICELGFGAGINFIGTYLAWKNSKSTQPLYYTSIEGFPLPANTITIYLTQELSSHKLSPSLKEETLTLIEELRTNYPLTIRGVHQLNLEHSKIFLNLIFHPVEFALKNLQHKFHIWYLDGFSPAKNADMWSEEIFREIYRCSLQGSTFATYASSKVVKENATLSGFNIKKQAGFSRKREMLVGTKEESENITKNTCAIKKVAVIGGGLSGASLTYSLKKRGIAVSLFEKEAGLFQKSSGNEKGVIMPQLSSKPDAQCRFFLSGFLHTIRLINALDQKQAFQSLKRDEVIRFCNVAKWKSIYEKLEEQGFSELCQRTEINNKPALNFLDAVAINPKELGERLLYEAGKIDLHLNSHVNSITETNSSITLNANGTEHTFDAVVFAGAFGSAFIDSIKWIPIEKIKGELGIISTPQGLTNKTMCYDGYVVPLENNKTLIGATYEHNAHDETPSFSTTKDLYNRLQNYQELAELKEENYLDGRVCFRTTSPDRLPIIGPIKKSSKIFVSLGHGSRGLISCPLSGELIAQMILDEPISIEHDLLKEILPIRYTERSTRREKSLEEIYPASYLWREGGK